MIKILVLGILSICVLIVVTQHVLNIPTRYAEASNRDKYSQHMSKGREYMSRFNHAGENNGNLDEDIAAAKAAITEFQLARQYDDTGGLLENAEDTLDGLLQAKRALKISTIKKDYIEPHTTAGHYASNIADIVSSR